MTFLTFLFQILSLLILARVLISWIDPMGNMRATQILHELTEPILAPIRSILPNIGMIDLSPLVAMLLLQLVGTFIINALR
ncbi:MAG: YggT family protein [Chloroflexaceae bacterium]|nr:YggT family protein [Chloroflexaceae bacterium]